jgi:hypothetical protein
MQALESTTFSIEAYINVSNIPDLPFEELSFNVSGGGSFAAETAAFSGMMPEHFLSGDMSFFPMMADMLRTVAADMTFTLEIPESLNALLHEDEQRLPDNVSLDFRMVDGVLYVNLADVVRAAPEATVPPGWVGLDIAELYSTMLPGMMENMPSVDMTRIMPMMTTLMQPENLGRFMAVERLPDATVNGQPTAVFEIRLNYARMMDIPAFQEMLQGMVEQEADIEGTMEAVRAMYEGMTLVITKNVGLEDRLVYSTEVQMEWDFTSFAETAPQFSFNMLITEASFNDAPEVVAPEDAILLPIQQMIPSPARN